MANQRILATEELVGYGHPTKADTINRLAMVEHNEDGTHKGDAVCKAWCKFNGTGTPAIIDDFNVDSLTDNGTGDWTVNFTTDLDSVGYSAVVSGYGDGTASQAYATLRYQTAFAVDAVRVGGVNGSNGAHDLAVVCLAVFGG